MGKKEGHDRQEAGQGLVWSPSQGEAELSCIQADGHDWKLRGDVVEGN